MEGAVTYTTLTSPALFISTGSQTFINTWFEGGSITVFPPLGQEASVTLAHCVLDVNAKLLATGNASVNLLGTDYNFGTFTVAGQQHAEPSDVHITIGRAPVHSQRPATLVNAGTIAASSVGAKYAFKGGVIQNDGDIIAGQTTITCNMLGNGTISFASPEPIFFGGVGWALGRLELDGKVGSGQTIDMTNDGTLVLGDLRDFHGTIADFSSALALKPDYTQAQENREAAYRGKAASGKPSVGSQAAKPTPAPQATALFDNGNIYATLNGPTRATMFTINTPCMVTTITTYHWNSARGAEPGTIRLVQQGGKVFGPWKAAGVRGQGGVPNATWIVKPGVAIAPGTYTIIDSSPKTWSHNAATQGSGISRIEGFETH